jgi:DNA-binding XRE family transcriptional regulator
MKPNRIVRRTEWTDEQRRQHAEIRERFRKEQPTREELLASGDAVEVGTFGELLDILTAAKKLRELRQRAGLSVAQVAEAMGTTESALAGIEGGQWIGRVELDLLYKYADAVGGQLRFVVQPLESGS